MAFRACRFALRAARSKVVALGARPALAAATGAIAAGYAFSKPSGCQAPQLVDVSGLTKVAKTDDVGLLPQPISPKYKTALVQIYVPSQPFGGSDKSNSGHRYDTIPIANGMIASGMSCQLIHYVPEEHDAFVKAMEGFDAIIVRCNPGQINAAGGEQTKFDDAMRALQKKGKQVWPSPDVMTNMGAKDALCKIANLGIGLIDTFAYYSPEEFAAGFKKTMAFQPRVIKQNRGSSGEGIWIIKLKSENYCKNFGDCSCTDDEVLEMMEACDNHSETHTVAEFIEFCVNGRTSKSGKWDTVGTGKYLEGGKAAGGQLVDQRFCPRIVEGEVRMNMIGDTCTGIIHKKPKAGGISAVGGTGSIYTFYGPDAPEFKQLSEDFLKNSIPTLMESLDLKGEPLPLWWTGDFINADPGKPGSPCTIDKWIVGEFNCSCVGISKCLPAYCNAEKPNASVYDIPVKDFVEATYLGNLMGQKALAILDGQGAKMSPNATKVLSRIEALRGAAKAGVLSSEEAGQSAWEALLACIKARRCLQNCYVLKYHWAPEQWRRSRLRNWVPELEGIVGALESAIGVTMLETQAVRAGFPTSAEVAATGTNPKQLPKNPRDVLRLFDLRQLLPQVIAISETLSTLRQLSRAVSLQTERILDAGKSGFPEVGVVEEIWNKTLGLGDLPRRARSERCAVM